MDGNDLETNLGISRRTLVKRGAIVGGTLMWAAPIVQSFNSPAFGQTAGTARCSCEPSCAPFFLEPGHIQVGAIVCTFNQNQCNCGCCCSDGNPVSCHGCHPQPGNDPCKEALSGCTFVPGATCP